MKTISPAALAGCKATILDVRTGAEHKAQCLALPHCHVPIDQLEPATFMKNNGLDATQDVYILCASGGRAARAAAQFAAAGFPNVHVVEGGINACAASMVRAQGGVISLERQVRIAAGSLVVLGVVLGFAVAPAWLALAGLVGGGLVFAGLTDWCGMGLLLAKAPWNKG